jgi:hypothetical protein
MRGGANGQFAMPVDDATFRKALRLIDDGLVTIAEAARLAGCSRQLVRYWCLRVQINPAQARADHLRRLWLRGRRRG